MQKAIHLVTAAILLMYTNIPSKDMSIDDTAPRNFALEELSRCRMSNNNSRRRLHRLRVVTGRDDDVR
jgi:hypothetical protein